MGTVPEFGHSNVSKAQGRGIVFASGPQNFNTLLVSVRLLRSMGCKVRDGGTEQAALLLTPLHSCPWRCGTLTMSSGPTTSTPCAAWASMLGCVCCHQPLL